MFWTKPYLPGTAARGDSTDSLKFRSRSGGQAGYVDMGGGVEVPVDLEIDPGSVWGLANEAGRLAENDFSRGEAMERAYDQKIDALTKAGLAHDLVNPERVAPRRSVPNEMGEEVEVEDPHAEFQKKLCLELIVCSPLLTTHVKVSLAVELRRQV